MRSVISNVSVDVLLQRSKCVSELVRNGSLLGQESSQGLRVEKRLRTLGGHAMQHTFQEKSLGLNSVRIRHQWSSVLRRFTKWLGQTGLGAIDTCGDGRG